MRLKVVSFAFESVTTSLVVVMDEVMNEILDGVPS